MTQISAGEVKSLRERTGAGMMECKKALVESQGNVDGAIEWLRKQGFAKAAKKAERAAKDGGIAVECSADGRAVAMVEIHCETDFVAKTDEFKTFAQAIATWVCAQPVNDVSDILAHTLDGQTVQDRQTALTAKIGENIGVSRFVRKTASASQKLAHYIHAGDKLGTVLLFDDPDHALSDEAARDLAMHVAAMNPAYLSRDQVPADVIAKEKEILRAQMPADKKPAEIREKILDGRLNKFFSEQCLVDQIFVKDPHGKRTVQQVLQGVGANIRLRDMVRMQVGA